MPGEDWRAIQGTPYYVSSMGRVRNRHGRVLTPRRHTNGYSRITLCDGVGGQRDFYIHRLVCRAFHGDPSGEATEVDHLNHDREDNRAQNLRWISRSDNLKRRRTPRGDQHSNSVLTDEKVRSIRRCISRGESNLTIGTRFGVHKRTISDIRNNKTWRHVHA